MGQARKDSSFAAEPLLLRFREFRRQRIEDLDGDNAVKNNTDDTIARPSSPNDLSWVGQMVLGGVSVVQGQISGNYAAPSYLQIDINQRTFTLPVDTGTATPGDPDMECDTEHHYSPFLEYLGWTIVPGNIANCVVLSSADTSTKNVLHPNPKATDAGITIARVTDGPNAGAWWVSGHSTKVYRRATVLKDFRTDADGFSIVSGDSVAAACQQNGAGTPPIQRTLSVVNGATCMNVAAYSQMLTQLWRHERCHMGLQKQFAEDSASKPDLLQALERSVGLDSSEVRTWALTSLRNITSRAWNYSAIIHTEVGPIYKFWQRNFSNSLWLRDSLLIDPQTFPSPC